MVVAQLIGSEEYRCCIKLNHHEVSNTKVIRLNTLKLNRYNPIRKIDISGINCNKQVFDALLKKISAEISGNEL